MNALNIALALLASIILIISDDVIDAVATETSDKYTYLYLLVIVFSFIYLHYMLYKYLYPVSSFTSEQRSHFASITSSYYYKSFFNGTIGLGYICLALTLLPILLPDIEFTDANYMLTAVIFVVVGTLSKARGLILFLLEEYKK